MNCLACGSTSCRVDWEGDHVTTVCSKCHARFRVPVEMIRPPDKAAMTDADKAHRFGTHSKDEIAEMREKASAKK